jgi:mannose-1-phosphate guanylyltransferase
MAPQNNKPGAAVTDLLQSTDKWFLVLAFLFFGGYFVWSVRRMFEDLKETIRELKDTIRELFDHRNDHETRITTIETRCKERTRNGECR